MSELLYQIALTCTPSIGLVNAKALVEKYGCASAIFNAPLQELERIEGIGTLKAKNIKSYKDFDSCGAEIEFIEKHKIKPLFLSDADYPKRLLNCYDSPTLLYYKGNANLNASKIVSIVGTRSNSDYGKQVCEKITEDLKNEDLLIVSGLAYGIDSIAHKAALKNNLNTVGVLAHGLDRIYPPPNANLAKEMLQQGGLLTEFPSGTNPDRQNFPRRNRIVAGMCDAIIVIESSKKGGSIITAELANSYNKDVFALPGKVTDLKSEGCNFLIRNNKAELITSAEDLLNFMNWKPKTIVAKKQRALFVELTANEKIIAGILNAEEGVPIDEIYLKSGLNSSAVAQALLMMEMNNLVLCKPGKIYQLL